MTSIRIQKKWSSKILIFWLFGPKFVFLWFLTPKVGQKCKFFHVLALFWKISQVIKILVDHFFVSLLGMRRTSDFPGPIGPDLVRIFFPKNFRTTPRTGPKISNFYLCFVVTCLCFQYFTIGPDPDDFQMDVLLYPLKWSCFANTCTNVIEL